MPAPCEHSASPAASLTDGRYPAEDVGAEVFDSAMRREQFERRPLDGTPARPESCVERAR